MRVLMLSLDKKIFENGSAVQRRLIALGEAVAKHDTPPREDASAPLARGELRVLVPEEGNKAWAFFKLWGEARRILNPSPHQNAVLPPHQNKFGAGHALGKGELRQYDLITVQDTGYLALLAYVLARRFRTPLEAQVHGFEKMRGVRKLIAGFVLRRADKVRVVSQRLKTRLAVDFGAPENKIYVLPVYTQMGETGEMGEKWEREGMGETEEKGEMGGEEKRGEMGKRGEKGERGEMGERGERGIRGKGVPYPFTFLTVGRLVPVKNVALQIRAFARLTKEYPQVRLRIVGDGPLLGSLKLKVKSLKLEDTIQFLGQQNNTAPFYEEADAFLLTSDTEGWGLAVTEAAGYGLPIIMTEVGLAGEFIKNEENGLVIPVGDDDALVAAIRRIIGDAEMRARLGAAARRSFLALPSAEEQIRKQVEAWGSLR